MTSKPVQFRLNGAAKAVFVDDGQNLLDVLRRGIGDFSPKYGCGQGTCGVCTVLIDGAPRLACLTLAETCEGQASRPRAGSPRGRTCTRCSRPSWTISPRSAGSARPAC